MPHYLSREKLAELEKEYEYLKNTRRREVGERLLKAKEFGDLSENSEYNEAKDEQAQVEYRISELEHVLRDAEIIKPNSKKDKITIGSVVTLKKANGSTVSYHIVGSHDSDPDQGKISNESPIGAALLNHEIGEKVSVHTLNGSVEYEILSIE